MSDKSKHFIVCAAAAALVAVPLSAWSGNPLSSAYGGLCAGLCLGAGKECGDALAPGNRWDWLDVAYDFLGSFAGSLFALVV